MLIYRQYIVNCFKIESSRANPVDLTGNLIMIEKLVLDGISARFLSGGGGVNPSMVPLNPPKFSLTLQENSQK